MPHNEIKKRPSIFILGAFDRFNYGDLLFPIIIEKMLKKIGCDKSLCFLGVERSDLRYVGGKKTESIRKLFEKDFLPEQSALIIAGGDVLAAEWNYIIFCLLQNTLIPAFKRLRSLIGDYYLKRLIQKFYGVSHDFPFVLEANDFKSSIAVAYNSVGGSGFQRLSRHEKKIIAKRLSSAAYLSVRDKRIWSLLQAECDYPEKIALSPDCAVLISELFSIQELANYSTENVIQIVQNNSQGYIIFQINESYGASRIQIIISELQKIQARLRCRIILLPIGRAPEHYDQIILEKVYQQLKEQAYFLPKSSIYDIMYLIANAKLFIGSSLHGNITAISYGVPHIGIKGFQKVEAFLDTWDHEEQKNCIDLIDLDRNIESRLQTPREVLSRTRQELIRLAYEHFQRMFSNLGLLEPLSNK